mmetsp:Transcript_81169/g.143130  ORF Transcript_81169/g.143130 Transcript_81169/m.143130 type:complete len:238 (+) Transcript_81169:206-919(+)
MTPARLRFRMSTYVSAAYCLSAYPCVSKTSSPRLKCMATRVFPGPVLAQQDDCCLDGSAASAIAYCDLNHFQPSPHSKFWFGGNPSVLATCFPSGPCNHMQPSDLGTKYTLLGLGESEVQLNVMELVSRLSRRTLIFRAWSTGHPGILLSSSFTDARFPRTLESSLQPNRNPILPAACSLLYQSGGLQTNRKLYRTAASTKGRSCCMCRPIPSPMSVSQPSCRRYEGAWIAACACDP